MAFKLPSRVLETTISTGTGALTLAGAVDSEHRAFADVLSNADTTFYFIEGGGDFEIGYGTYSGGVLTRTTVLKSSNSNAAVNWASGAKLIGIAPLGPSDLDATNLGRLQGALGISSFVQTLLDDANAGAFRVTAGAFGTVAKQVFTGAGTYTPTPGMLYCIVEAVGGGGGGGGCASDAAHRWGGGGGAGGYSRSLLTAADIGASKAVAIGAGGAGGTAGDNHGTGGGATTLGTTIVVANGGSGGNRGSTLGGGQGGAAGTGNIVAAPGATAESSGSAPATVFLHANPGASGPFGAGGRGTLNSNGSAASGYGAGGGGGSDRSSGGNRSGGDGTAGLIIITEFLP